MKYLFERNASVLNTSHSVNIFLSSIATVLENFYFPTKNMNDSSYGRKTKHGIINYGSHHALHKLENVLELVNTWPAQ
jgi:hypothetical protein